MAWPALTCMLNNQAAIAGLISLGHLEYSLCLHFVTFGGLVSRTLSACQIIKRLSLLQGIQETLSICH